MLNFTFTELILGIIVIILGLSNRIVQMLCGEFRPKQVDADKL